MIRYLTSGESHGSALTTVIEGFPSNFVIPPDYINKQLARRQMGFGRSFRMKIENDSAEFISGIRHGKTLGSPITVLIKNKDWENWKDAMSAFGDPNRSKVVTVPRPGHADLNGVIKYHYNDIRNSLERSSARETAIRVAACSFSRLLLENLGIQIGSYVEMIGSSDFSVESSQKSLTFKLLNNIVPNRFTVGSLSDKADKSPVRIMDTVIEKSAIKQIEKARENGDTLGGTFVVVVTGLPPGFGSFMSWDRKLDGLLAQAIMSINAVKAVEIGGGFRIAQNPGSVVMDEIFIKNNNFSRKTNFSGGIEGGVSNGMPVIIRAAMKPIPTLMKPLDSVDLATMKKVRAFRERSDYTAVPACSIVAESVVAHVLANAIIEKIGGDSYEEILPGFNNYKKNLFHRVKSNFQK
ncbi:MAG TPA: chorismate synthase [Ignavibacteriaceae bacterium]|nr:chorismate synthase [Ignavibacteriaceae bacterium]